MENLRGIALMVGAMALFAVTDSIIKLSTRDLPVAQIVLLMGLGGGSIFAVLSKVQGHRIFDRDFLHPAVVTRNLCEIIGTACFVTALSKIDISTASAILQATPLAVTLGAVVFLKEYVGWRRWTAILIGFLGVLLIVRPGTAGFEPAALWAFAGMLALGMRDLSTRLVPTSMPTMRIATYGMSMLAPTGLLLFALGQEPAPMSAFNWLSIGCAIGFGVLGYYGITAAMRSGDISLIAPFRYSRILFALIIGALVFSETPDLMMLTGAAITVVAGLYSFVREHRLRKHIESAISVPNR